VLNRVVQVNIVSVSKKIKIAASLAVANNVIIKSKTDKIFKLKNNKLKVNKIKNKIQKLKNKFQKKTNKM